MCPPDRGNSSGLLDAADLHDQRVIDEFRVYFAPLEGQYELRTEPWAPDGLASDEALDEALRGFREWAVAVLRDTDCPTLVIRPVAVPAEDDRRLARADPGGVGSRGAPPWLASHERGAEARA
jgi:hypothetical protein